MSLHCVVLRTNRTSRQFRVKDKADSFDFEGGTYYIVEDYVTLRKKGFSYSPYLYYIEGYSMPLCYSNVTINKIVDKEGKELEIPENIFIDAFSIHELTSRRLLDVLSGSVLSAFDIILLILVGITMVLGILNLLGVAVT